MWGMPCSLCIRLKWAQHLFVMWSFSFTETCRRVRFFFFFTVHVVLEHISGYSAEWLLSAYSLPFHSPSPGSWQPLGLHIIWVISLYFYAADVSPCQQASWQSKMENPPLLKCCTSPPSPLSVALPTRTFVIPWDTVPHPILIVGKHILIDARVCIEVCRSDTQEHRGS